MLSDKNITLLREELEKRVKEYRKAGNTEHVKLDIDPELLHKVLFNKKIEGYYDIAVNQECLQTLDLTGVSWENVSVACRDFEGTKGVCINPQTVDQKMLTYTKLSDVEIKGDFNDVNIMNTNFKGAKGNLKINLQEINGKSVICTVLDGVEIIGDYDFVDIRGANFKGAKGNLNIDPQKIRDGNFEDTILEGVTITGNGIINKEKISGANFTGSTGAILYVDTEEDLEDLKKLGTILKDVQVNIEYNQTMEKIENSFAKQKTKTKNNG